MNRVSLWGAVTIASILLGGLAWRAAAAPLRQTTPTPTPSGVTFGYTYNSPDGNRYVSGQGHLPDAAPLDVALDGLRPGWFRQPT